MHDPTKEVATAVVQSIEGEQTILVDTNEVATPVMQSIVDTEASVPPLEEGDGRGAGLPAPYWLFISDDTISLIQKRNYKVRISWGSTPHELVPVKVLFDTGAGPNLVGKQTLPAAWLKKIRPTTDVRLTSASKQAMPVVGALPIVVRIGDLCVRVWFGVVKQLETLAILGTSFIDRFIKGIFLQERRIVPIESHPVAILSSFTVNHQG